MMSLPEQPIEVIHAILRLEARKLQMPKLELKVFRSDDGFVYAYVECGTVQGRKEQLGTWQ